MRPRRVIAAVVLVFVVVVGAARLASPGARRPPVAPAPTPSATPAAPSPQPTAAPERTPAPSKRSAAEINRQDRVSHEHARREQEALDQRPLLQHLPLELAGVTIDIFGLAADDATTILTVQHPDRSRAYAEDVYERSLAAFDDTGAAYEVRYQP